MVKSVGMLKSLLDGALIILIAFALLSILFGPRVIYPPMQAMIAVPITFWSTEGGIMVENEILGSGTIGTVDGVATFSLPLASWPTLLSIVSEILAWAHVFIILVLLRRMAASIVEGGPFTEANIGRIRAMGWFTIAFEILRNAAQTGAGFIVQNTSVVTGFEVIRVAEFKFDAILIGALLLVLAEIFRHGWSLQSDADFTV